MSSARNSDRMSKASSGLLQTLRLHSGFVQNRFVEFTDLRVVIHDQDAERLAFVSDNQRIEGIYEIEQTDRARQQCGRAGTHRGKPCRHFRVGGKEDNRRHGGIGGFLRFDGFDFPNAFFTLLDADE